MPDGVEAPLTVNAGVSVLDGVTDGVAVTDDVHVGVPVRVPVPDAVRALVDDGVLGVDAVLVGVFEGVAVPDAENEDVGVLVAAAEVVGVGVDEHDDHTYTEEYGALVTPRNTVFEGAVASVAATSLTVLYEYSVVGEVAYSIKTPQSSDRPAMEMIIAPDSSSMAGVGVCRDQDVVFTYLAMLLVVSAATSVDQMVDASANTNPYGWAVELIMRLTVRLLLVGRPVNDRIPAPCPPPLELSDQYSWEEVATREPVHALPALSNDTQPEK